MRSSTGGHADQGRYRGHDGVGQEAVGDNSYQETDKRDGKVVGVTTFSTGPDGKLNVVCEDKLDGSRIGCSADKS